MILRNLQALAVEFAKAQASIRSGKHIKLAWSECDPRSIDQNELSHQWYADLALALPVHTAREWKAYCKLHLGVPIARAEIPEFRAVYDKAIRPQPYETKLELMDFLPVTSLFSKKQFTEYLDRMQSHFAQQGTVLESAR